MNNNKTLQDYYYQSLALLSYYGVFDVSYSMENGTPEFQFGSLNGIYNILKPSDNKLETALLEFEENYPNSKSNFLHLYKQNKNNFNVGKLFFGAENPWSMLLKSTFSIFHDNEHFLKLFFAQKYTINDECLDLKNINILLKSTEQNYNEEAANQAFKYFLTSSNLPRYLIQKSNAEYFQNYMIIQFFFRTFRKNNLDKIEKTNLLVNTLNQYSDSNSSSFYYDIIKYNTSLFDDYPLLHNQLLEIKQRIINGINPLSLSKINPSDYTIVRNSQNNHIESVSINFEILKNHYSTLLSPKLLRTMFVDEPILGNNTMGTSFIDNGETISFTTKISQNHCVLTINSTNKSFENIDTILLYVDDFIKKFYPNICYNNELINDGAKVDLINNSLKKQREINLISLLDENKSSPSNIVKRKI